MQDNGDDQKNKKDPRISTSTASTFSAGKTPLSQEERLERHLKNVEVFTALQEKIHEIRKEYEAKHADVDRDDPELNQKIIHVLDEAIHSGAWEGGLFFETTGKNLLNLRNELAESLDLSGVSAEAVTTTTGAAIQHVISEGMCEVYVSLYLSSEDNRQQWEDMLAAIARTSAGRPVYKQEQDAKEYLDTKRERGRDAYVVVKIKKEDILIPKNRSIYAESKLGRELLLLRESALSSENIVRFIHRTGVYFYRNGKLVREDEGG